METKANHVLIGAFTLALIAAILLFILWASKYAGKDAYHEYDILFHESVTGLSVGGVVQYNGIEVGNVRDLHLSPKDPSLVIARIRLKANTPVKVDTVAKLELQGLATGISMIQLSGGTPDSPLLYTSANDDQHIPTIAASQSGFSKLLSSSEGIAKTATDVLDHINSVLSEDNVKHVGKTLANLQAITDTLANQRQDLAAILRNARDSTDHLNRTLASAEKVMAGLDGQLNPRLPEMMAHLDHSAAQLDSITRNVDDLLKANRSAIDSFANQGLAQLGPTLVQLRQVLKEVNRITSRLQADPAGYLLSRDKPQEFVPK